MPEEQNNRDLILAPNEYAFILDESKGNIVVYSGPYKTSLANTDKPVIYDKDEKRFKKKSLQESIKLFPIANEESYIVIENPSEEDKYPQPGANTLTKLKHGRKININGPVTFALWPGQIVKVIQGHHLRSNQYLVARVYNEESAKKHWQNAVIKPQKGLDKTKDKPIQQALTMGQILIIKGTETSFYMPQTGIEIIKEGDTYTRDAVSLENLEYCILLDENGGKRFIHGPSVVFPDPTETFVEKNGNKKFKVIELNEQMGIYVKVVEPYKEHSKEVKPGEELFITGKQQKLYYPRPEQAIIKYGENLIHYAIAIPEGESRYVLDKNSGKIFLIKGPNIYLPDPRKYVIVNRVLSEKEVLLWYPGNKKALEHNQVLANAISFDDKSNIKTRYAIEYSLDRSEYSNAYAGEGFERKQKYTPPRSITLNTKYEGAPIINVWTGYAVQIIDKQGKRRVVIGPNSIMLEYDEFLEHLELSTGRPKNEKRPMQTVYLRVQNNKVSDLIYAETKDIVMVNIEISYKINFVGDNAKWFSVENYVKLATDNLRSIIRHEAKKHKIEDFYNNAAVIIRDIVLGKSQEGKRKGKLFAENNMLIYDIELLNISIGTPQISELLKGAQLYAVKQALEANQKEQLLETFERTEKAKQKILAIEHESRIKNLEIEKNNLVKELEIETIKSNKEIKIEELQTQLDTIIDTRSESHNKSELLCEKDRHDLEITVAEQKLNQKLREIKASTDAVVEKSTAISPDLIAALQGFSDKHIAGKLAESMAPLAILGGKSIAEVFNNLLQGTALGNTLNKLKK